MLAAEEAMIGGQGAGVCGSQHQMLGVLDQGLFRLGVVAPEQEHHRFFPLIQQPDDIIGELLPAFALVGIRLSGTDGQHGVQQQHAVFCPVGQFAVLAGVVDAHIVLDLLEDVHQRRRRSHAFPHGKAEPVSLIGVVIGILSQDHCPHLGIGGIFQGVENIIHAGINGLGAVFRQQKLPQVLVVGLGEFAV